VSTTELPAELPELRRPLRADAQRNYDKVLTAAREAFAERGASTSLEDIARRAGVGIGTLYRHFPTRQALLEAVYLGEVERVSAAAYELQELPEWDALSAWLQQLSGYMATKAALAAELIDYLGKDTKLFSCCRASLTNAGQLLIDRAQKAGVMRADVGAGDVFQMVMGIAKIPNIDAAQSQHLLSVMLDGLRYRSA
jgi:AcrR family transcriptional regulator